MSAVFQTKDRTMVESASSRSRAFYLEVVLLLAGFAFIAVIIFQIFGLAYGLSKNASETEGAITSARNVAEIFTASASKGDFTAALSASPEFAEVVLEDSVCSFHDAQGRTITVYLSDVSRSSGVMRVADITVAKDGSGQGDPLYTLEVSDYDPGWGAVS